MSPHPIKSHLLFLLLIFIPTSFVVAQEKSSWRMATSSELQAVLPTRAPVEKERIETEMRTASGIIDSKGKIIAGVVLITAGYSADGKYSHYLVVQSPISFGSVSLASGNYVIGWQRGEDDRRGADDPDGPELARDGHRYGRGGQSDLSDAQRRREAQADADRATAIAKGREPVEDSRPRRPVWVPGHQRRDR